VQNLRINNVEIPNNKRIEYSLQYIYGIGHKTAQDILASTVGAALPTAARAAAVAGYQTPAIRGTVTRG
jgi:ribosomal protein S13